jgi:amino-acid N-acetyltransferase
MLPGYIEPVKPTVAPARPADLPDVLQLLALTKLPVAGIENHVATTLVARRQQRVVGCAAVEVYGNAGLLRSVAVDPEVQGQGLGQELTTAALDLARTRGVRTVFLLTTTAGEFFPRFGFRTITRAEVAPAVRRSVEFTTACPDTALAMALELGG